MIEDVELNSSCIQPNCQGTKEIELSDIVNSAFVNKAVELFQPNNPIRIKSKT